MNKMAWIDAEETVEQMEMYVRRNWGDVPLGREVLMHDDGGYTVELFHTIGVVRDGEPVRARLVYWSDEDRFAERIDHQRVGQIAERRYEEEVQI